MATIKFSELQPITTPSGNSVFALGDVDSGVSKRITFSDLTNAIITPDLFTESANDIIDSINGANNVANDLNATNLWYDGAYRPGSYFLDYGNFANTPNIPADLSDLTNSTGFLRFNNNKVSYIPAVGGRIDMTTSFVAEGNNLYYTEERVTAFFDANFADYYTQFSTTFDEGNLTDSYFDTAGQFVNNAGSGDQLQSSTIRISNADRLNAYATGQVLRIYGAANAITGVAIDATSAGFSLNAVNFPTDSPTDTFRYKIAEFDYTTGEIAPASAEQSVSIRVPDELDPGTTITEAFNQTYFIRLSLTSTRESRGVLVYRNAPGDGVNNYKLVAVLGPKEIGSGIWIDYYDEDYNSWTGKASDNSYSSIVHFPLTAPSASRRGWVDRTISNVTAGSGFIDITLSSSVFINSDALCQVAHNDTSKIQAAINNNSNAGLKSVTLNAKRYVASSLTIPDDFGLTGTPNITRISRLPWATTQNTTNFIRSASTNGASEISFVGIDIDGNALNHYLYSDTVNIDANYAVDLGYAPVNALFDKVRILKPLGGGIYAPNHVNLRLTNCVIADSGLSDRLANLYSPLYATNGTNLVATSNRFENFTNHIDASITNKGIVTNNIITNCGSGLLLYGSSFVSAEDNVTTGPANEFISTPDTLNSEFDSVNISLQNAYLSSGEYTSPNFKYQENGLNFNLTGNTAVQRSQGGSANPSFANVYYDTFYVQRSNSGVEEVYEANTGIVLNDRAGLDKSLGEFGFTIDANTVAEIMNAGGAYSYSTLSANNANHVGIVYTANFEREVEAGSATSANTSAGGAGDVELIINGKLQYIAVGSQVRVRNVVGDANIPSTIGTVTALNTSAANDRLTVRFTGVTLTGSLTSADINIIDRFVMAKGRIL